MASSKWTRKGSEPTQIVCKTTFRRILKESFKDIKIGSIAKDTCGACWEFKSQLKTIDSANARRRSAEFEGEPALEEQSDLEPNSIEFGATNEEIVEDTIENNESNNTLINNSQSTSSACPNSSNTNCITC